jgi:hypothetical protein
LRKAILTGFLNFLVFLLVFAFPLTPILLIYTALDKESYLFTTPGILLAKNPHFSNHSLAWIASPFSSFFINSVPITDLATTG